MKNHRALSSTLLAFFLAAVLPVVAFGAPLLSVDSQAGLLYSYTKLPDLSVGIQPGWQARISALVDSRNVFDQGLASDPPTSMKGIVFSGRLNLDIFSLGQSAPLSDGNLYRAWQGIGLSLLGGIRSPAFRLPIEGLEASAAIEAGGGLRATKYTGTGLVSANPAILAQAKLTVSISRHIELGIALPVELAWKSGGTALMFGLCGVFAYH